MYPDTFDRVEQYLIALIDEYDRIRKRQFAEFNGYLKSFLEDLFNHPLERPWRESLARFQEHYWQQIGMRLAPSGLRTIEALIERILSDARVGGVSSQASPRIPAPRAAIPPARARRAAAL